MASMSTLASPLAPTSPRVATVPSARRHRGVAFEVSLRVASTRAHARVAPDPRSAVAACVLRGPATRGVGDARARRARRVEASSLLGTASRRCPRRAGAEAGVVRARGGVRRWARSTRRPRFPKRPAVGASKYRFAVVSLVALALLLCNADRVIMSVAGVPLAAQNGWGAETLGLVQSSFLWGYTLTPFLGGVLADKIGGKNVLLAGIATWSIATALTPFAAAASLPALLACRAVMGLGEGVALPCMNNITARWVPRRERSRAVAACMAGFQSGSVVGLLAAPVMLRAGGVSRPFPRLRRRRRGVGRRLGGGRHGVPFPRRRGQKRAFFSQTKRGGAPPDRGRRRGRGGTNATAADSPEKEKRVSLARLLSAPPVLACVFANFVNNWGYFIPARRGCPVLQAGARPGPGAVRAVLRATLARHGGLRRVRGRVRGLAHQRQGRFGHGDAEDHAGRRLRRARARGGCCR